jgi:hypothetical protein
MTMRARQGGDEGTGHTIAQRQTHDLCLPMLDALARYSKCIDDHEDEAQSTQGPAGTC